MFVRTERLILRPSWPEDAPRLAKALNVDFERLRSVGHCLAAGEDAHDVRLAP